MHGTYEDLKVWRRAAVSVPSNIAEGKGRFSRKELLQFLFHARGSLLELQTQITIGRELGFIAPVEGKRLTDLASEVGRLLNGLVNRFQDERSVDTLQVISRSQVSGPRS